MTQLLLYLIILLICVSDFKYRKNRSVQEWFEKQNTDQLRGICALLIVVHHLATQNFSTGIFHQVGYISVISGYLLVGYFFLVSGYGLEYGDIYVIKRKPHPLMRRLVTIGVPYITIGLLYWAYGKYDSKPINLGDIVVSIITGDPIVKYSWYSVAIIIVYIIFEISKINPSKSCNLYVMTLLLGGYIAIGVIGDYSESWYNTILIVILGILVARYKDIIYIWISQHCKSSLIISSILLVTGAILQIKCGNYFGWPINIVVKQLTLLSAVYLMMMVDYLFYINSAFFKWIALISYEIYLTHGFVMKVAKDVLWFDTAGIAYAGTVIVGTILLSSVEHLLNKKAISALNRWILTK